MDGLSITAKQAPEQRPDYVVYKTVRVAFTSTGDPIPNHRRAISSAMMELYALVHRPLLEHPTIVNYVALAWGSNPFEPTHRLPIPVVEYAEHGTLADLQQKDDLPSESRQSLCLDVALGLDILHRCGIVHGDVKAENVLIFHHPEKQYIAKVADFGFSVVEAAADAAISVGGTRPWKAPEANVPVPKAQLKLTDVYSFGLLVWRVGTDGKNPFDLILPETLKGEQYFAEIERLKQTDEFKAKSGMDSWYPIYVTQRSQLHKQPTIPFTELLQRFQNYLSNPALMVARPEDLDSLLSQLMSAMPSFGLPTDSVKEIFMQKALLDPFYGRIDKIMEKSGLSTIQFNSS